MLEPMPVDASATEEEGVSLAASASCDIGMFVPLVQMCASQSLFQVKSTTIAFFHVASMTYALVV
jgi:hypothetical protein